MSAEIKLGLDAKNWKFRFKFEGKRYTLFKNEPTRDASWQMDVWVRGTRIQRSLDSNIADAAEKKAVNDFIKPAKRGESVSAKKLRSDYAKLGILLDAFDGLAAGDVDERVARNYKVTFFRVVRRGLGKDSMTEAAFRDLSSSVLTGPLVSGFEDWMHKAGAAAGRERNSTKRSVAGDLRNTRAILKKRFLPRYAELGVKLPDLNEFLNRETAPADKLVKLPPSDELLTKTARKAVSLKRDDRPAYIAWMLGVSSLRRREVSQARWTWAKRIGGKPYIVVPAGAAKSGADRAVPVDERVLVELDEFKATRCKGLDAEEELFILPSPRRGQGGPDCWLRAQSVFRRVDKWMRSLGWTTNHTLHEMRACYLRTMDDAYGIDAAQTAGGHSDRRTTEENYIGLRSLKHVTVNSPMLPESVVG